MGQNRWGKSWTPSVLCDVGVIPNRNNAFTEINTPTRIFEYLSLGKPVISPRAKGVTDYFGPEDMIYFELGDAADLARQLEFVYRQPAEARAITHRGQAVYLRQCWSHAREKSSAASGKCWEAKAKAEVRRQNEKAKAS